MFTPSQLERLRARLRDAGYTYDAVAAALTDDGQQALLRNTTLAGARRLAAHPGAAATLAELFILQRTVPADRVEAVLGPIDDWPDLLTRDSDGVGALLDLRPYGSPDDGASGWLVSDLTPGLDGVSPRVNPDWVLGASPASTTLAQLVVRQPVERALDLGTGCGVQSLHLARHAREVIATDLNPRACDLARATFALNGLDVDVREGSLYDPVAGEQFDLIVTNPPYVMAPPRGDATLTYREAGLTSDDLVRQVVVGGVDHLSPGGTLEVLANWVTSPDDPGRRVLDWLAGRDDVDVIVIERERLDAYAYIEMWLADAGLSGSDRWRPRYAEWLRYFDELGVREVSMGWIVVRRHSGAGLAPYRRSESWPYAVAQPVGPSLADELDGIALSRGLSDDAVLDRAWVLRDDVEEERTQTPGAADPTSIVFRRRTGMCRAYLASSTMAAVLGVCDGDLTLRQITAAVAALTDQDPEALTADVIREVRGLIDTGWFDPDAS